MRSTMKKEIIKEEDPKLAPIEVIIIWALVSAGLFLLAVWFWWGMG